MSLSEYQNRSNCSRIKNIINSHYIIQQLMSLKSKREEISKEIRRKHLDDYFKKVRLSLQENLVQHNNHGSLQISKISTSQILEVINFFRKQRQPINFAIINECALSSDGPWSAFLCIELAKVVLQSFRKNGYAIASLVHALAKYSQAPFLNEIYDLSGKIMQMLEQNLVQENKINNGEAITYLIFNILLLSDSKEDFYFLPKYYEIFANSNGYLNTSLLLLLREASRCRQLLPSPLFVQAILRNEINYASINLGDLTVICQFLQNFVCFDLDINLYFDLVNWIERRLKEKKFPLKLKANLINILTMLFCYQIVAGHTNQSQDITFGVMQEIILIARFGAPQTKVAAIVCLCQFITILQSQKLSLYIQNTQIFEIIVISLELILQNQHYCRLLQVLATIFCIDQKWVRFAQRMGIVPLLDKMFSSNNVKISHYAQQTLEIMHSYN